MLKANTVPHEKTLSEKTGKRRCVLRQMPSSRLFGEGFGLCGSRRGANLLENAASRDLLH
jgi:hypothetical protein